MRHGEVWVNNQKAGVIAEHDEGYSFQYDSVYLKLAEATPVSLTLPLQVDAFKSDFMFPFFDGLIPEGWLLEIVEKNWKINPRDRMGLLLASCRDCIGNVSVIGNE